MLNPSLNNPTNLDQVFQALADPTRRAIIERLKRGPASVSELAQPFSMSLSAVVQHIQLLEASGLIESEKLGRVRTCRLDRAKLDAALTWIELGRGGANDPPDPQTDTLTEQPVRQGVFCLD